MTELIVVTMVMVSETVIVIEGEGPRKQLQAREARDAATDLSGEPAAAGVELCVRFLRSGVMRSNVLY